MNDYYFFIKVKQSYFKRYYHEYEITDTEKGILTNYRSTK